MDKEEFYPDTSYIQTTSSIYFVSAFAFLANYLAVNVVTDKEKKIKEGMLMMGLNSGALWYVLSHFNSKMFSTLTKQHIGMLNKTKLLVKCQFHTPITTKCFLTYTPIQVQYNHS